ncbi:MAG: SDR family oxidoreductase [Sphingomonadaceae bacterium]|nr:SDR family oxidoreductase [Sphingomonadaceae bacterium]
MAGRLAGKVALVTGGAQGLGAAMAARFVSEGARVVVSDINADGARRQARRLGEAAAAREHDVTDPDQWRDVLDYARRSFGGIHILVNNAGIGAGGTVEDTSLEEWRRVHAIDLDSVFLGCKYGVAAIAATCRGDGAGATGAGAGTGGGARGSILNISSIAGVIAAANLAAYNSAKAGVRHLTKSVALHCAKERYPITCNSIHPVFVDTPILDDIVDGTDRAAALAKLGRQVPLGRVGQPDDVAWGAVYLVSDEAQFVTGAELYIDGGISAM